MTSKVLTQTDTVRLAQVAERVAKFDLLNGSEAIILAIKPSLWYVLLVSGRWLAVLLGVCVAAWLMWQRNFFVGQAQLLLGIALVGISIRLVFGLLQWQSRAYILTNFRMLSIRGVLRVDMFQCHLLRLRDVPLTTSTVEKLLGLGTIGLVHDSSAQPAAYWRNIRRPEQVRQQIIEAINALKGRSPQTNSTSLPPSSILPVKQSQAARTELIVSKKQVYPVFAWPIRAQK